jgi:hypothetical protein
VAQLGRAKGRKKEEPPAPWTGGGFIAESDDSHVLRFFPLAARGDVELDPLPFLQRAVAAALDIRVVDEDVVAVLT